MCPGLSCTKDLDAEIQMCLTMWGGKGSPLWPADTTPPNAAQGCCWPFPQGQMLVHIQLVVLEMQLGWNVHIYTSTNTSSAQHKKVQLPLQQKQSIWADSSWALVKWVSETYKQLQKGLVFLFLLWRRGQGPSWSNEWKNRLLKEETKSYKAVCDFQSRQVWE